MQSDHLRGYHPALRALAKSNDFGAQRLKKMFDEAKSAENKKGSSIVKGLTIAEASFKRLLDGNAVPRKNLEFDFLYRALIKEGHTLRQNHTASDAKLLPRALDGFFTNDALTPARANMDDVHACIQGTYTMFRRDYDDAAEPDGVRVSSVKIIVGENGIEIEELQNIQQPRDPAGYRQCDFGYLFAYGDFLFFLTKELGGTAVKLGVVEDTLPDIKSKIPLTYFWGRLSVYSHRDRYPSVRFVCLKIEYPGEVPKSDSVRLRDLPDKRVRSLIEGDYMAEEKFLENWKNLKVYYKTKK